MAKTTLHIPHDRNIKLVEKKLWLMAVVVIFEWLPQLKK